MQEETEYFRSVLDNLTGGFLSVGLKGEIVYLNPMAGRILRFPNMESLIGQTFAEALAPFPAVVAVVSEALEKQRTVHRAELTIEHGDKPLTIGYSTLQVKTKNGRLLGVGVIFQELNFAAPAAR